MEYRTLANTQLKLSSVTFGAWAAGGWLWGGTERNEALKAMLASFEHGVTSIDTAPIYGQGTSEEIIGEFLTHVPRNRVQILTKYGMRWDLKKGNFYMKSKTNEGVTIDIYKIASKESIIEECENSLRRLRTDYIDLYQIHWPDTSTPISESMEAVEILIKQGKVRYAGVSNYNVPQLEDASKYIQIVSNQVPYSIIRRGIEETLVPFCIERNISILAYSPLERGLLTGKIKPGHLFGVGDHRADLATFSNENIVKTNHFLNSIKPVAIEKGVTISQLILQWTLRQPGITVVLAGARNPAQAIENAKSANLSLTHADIQFIDEEFKEKMF